MDTLGQAAGKNTVGSNWSWQAPSIFAFDVPVGFPDQNAKWMTQSTARTGHGLSPEDSRKLQFTVWIISIHSHLFPS
jgi:hypothetical protein